VQEGSDPSVATDDRWLRSANCLGIDASLFLPGLGASVSEAKGVCRGCTVRTECLDFALEVRELTGVWGGLTGEERRSIMPI